MLAKKLDQITFADLDDLVTNQVREGKTIEYKREFPTSADSQLISVLAGVSALANTSGGDFLIGVEAKNGVALAVPGVPLTNPDQQELRLESWLRTGLEPRLPHCDIRSVPIDETGNYVIIVRVPKSWNGPHRVIHNDKFYGRNSAGKYPLDVSELRTAFTFSEQIGERIRNFRAERIAAIYGDEAPLPLPDYGKLLLHIIPLSAFASYNTLDIAACYHARYESYPPLRTLDDAMANIRLTLEGLLVYSTFGLSLVNDYTLLFRTGILEALEVLVSYDPARKYIPSEAYEQSLLQALPRYLRYLKNVSIEPPLYLFLTFIGVKGYQLAVSERSIWYSGLETITELRKDVLQLPEVVLETLDIEDISSILHPLFDLVWNAFGYPCSYNFDQNGKWIGQH